MLNKYSKTMTVNEMRQQFVDQFKQLSAEIDNFDRMKIAIKLKVSLATITRYIDTGKIIHVRNFDLAEQILNEIKATIEQKQSAESAV